MVSEPIKPALTPEEWVEALTRDNQTDRVGTDRDRFAVYWLEGGGGYEQGPGGAAHGAAAMLLAGQEFGFTWTDVDRIRDIADSATTQAFNVWCNNLADRVAALLPPR